MIVLASPDLASLAERIRAEHALCQGAMQNGLAHGVRAGRLLVEARAQCAHGLWGPWLREHCEISERSAQGYMRLARSLAEGDPQRVADLSLRAALRQLAEPRSAPDPEHDVWGWAEAQLEGPFSAWDFAGPNTLRLLTMKLLHHAGVPAAASLLLGLEDQYHLPALRLTSDDELHEACTITGALAQGTAPALRFDTAGMSHLEHMKGVVALKLTAQRACAAYFTECHYRLKTTGEQLEKERARIQERLLERIDTELATVRGEATRTVETSA